MLTVNDIITILQAKRRMRKPPLADLKVTSFEKGLKIWNAESVERFFFEKSLKWVPRSEVAVFIPCSAWKPYPYSQSHKFGYLKALRPALNKIDLFVVSEPMGIVPYCYSDEHPVDSYEYNPYDFFIGKLSNPLARRSLEIFVARLASWIKKYHGRYEKRILILPKSWYLKVFKKALRKLRLPEEQYFVITMSGRASNSVQEMREQLGKTGLY